MSKFTYLKEYNEFIRLSNKQIEKQIPIVEKLIIGDFNKNFWNLSLKSEVFTEIEKQYIKENLIGLEIDLLKENFFKDTLQAIKDKGGEILTNVKNKISKLVDNIKDVVTGVVEFLKGMVKKLGELVIPTKELLAKAKEGIKQELPKLKKEVSSKRTEWEKEVEDLKETGNWIKTKFVTILSQNIQSQSDGAEKSVDQDLDVIVEAENESIDVLSSFYEINEAYKEGDKVKYVNKQGETVEKEISKVDGDTLYFIGKDGKEFTKDIKDIIKDDKVKEVIGTGKDYFLKWVLKMKETSPPKDGKARWWMKLIFKVINFCLTPWAKIISACISYMQKNALYFGSVVVSKLKGPGPYQFALMTAIGLSLYGLIKSNIDIFEKSIKGAGFDMLPEFIIPYLKEYVPYVDEVEGCLAVFSLVLILIDFVGMLEETSEEKPEGHDRFLVPTKQSLIKKKMNIDLTKKKLP